MVMLPRLLIIATLFLALVADAKPNMSPTVEISPGVHMPRINLGTCCGSESTNSFPIWYAHGGRGVDTALDYGKECPGGKQTELAAAILKSGAPRTELFLTTKIRAGLDLSRGGPLCLFASPEYALKQVREDIKELNVTQLDLVLLHAPCVTTEKDYALWQGLEQALEMNLTRAIGVSNYNAKQLGGLLQKATHKPVVNQCHLSIGTHDDQGIAFSQQHGVVYEAYQAIHGCPFQDSHVQSIAKAHNTGVSQVCLRWVLQRGAILAAGLGSNQSHMASYAQENLDLYGFELSENEMAYLNQLK